MKSLVNLFILTTLLACAAGPIAQFEQNHQKWQSAGIPHYRMSVSVLCFCPFSQDMPVRIEVEDGAIISMLDVRGAEITRADPRFGFIEPYATIDQLFTILEAALKGAADDVSVTYDLDHGYPSEMNFDYIRNAVDDEMGIRVEAFDELPE